VYEVQACNREEIDEAFEAARRAQKLWSTTPLWKRADLLKKAAAKLREHAPAIAEVMVNEVCKPLKDAIKEVLRTADLFEYTAEEGVRLEGQLYTSDSFQGEKRNKLAVGAACTTRLQMPSTAVCGQHVTARCERLLRLSALQAFSIIPCASPSS